MKWYPCRKWVVANVKRKIYGGDTTSGHIACAHSVVVVQWFAVRTTCTVIHGRVCQFFGVRHSPQGGDARGEKARAEAGVFCLTTYVSLRKIGDMAPFAGMQTTAP